MYCINSYSCANKTSLNKLRIKQKEAIRIICNMGRREHMAPLFTQLNNLPLDQLININVLKFMHSFTHNKLPLSFYQMWTTNREHYPNKILRNADQLYIPAHNYATLKRMPMYNFPAIWNSDGNDKFNPIQHQYLKIVKNRLLSEF